MGGGLKSANSAQPHLLGHVGVVLLVDLIRIVMDIDGARLEEIKHENDALGRVSSPGTAQPARGPKDSTAATRRAQAIISHTLSRGEGGEAEAGGANPG